jgi:hypothetical protein
MEISAWGESTSLSFVLSVSADKMSRVKPKNATYASDCVCKSHILMTGWSCAVSAPLSSYRQIR